MSEADRYHFIVKYGSSDDVLHLALSYTFNYKEEIEDSSKNSPDAFEELAMRAMNGDIVAGYYIISKGVSELFQDKFGTMAIHYQDEAIINLHDMADNENPDAIYAKACLAYNVPLAGDLGHAPPEWENRTDYAAKLGSSWACLHLYTYYKRKCPINYEKALEYLEIGASQDGMYSRKCQYRLDKLKGPI